jgi:hypothetical protein
VIPSARPATAITAIMVTTDRKASSLIFLAMSLTALSRSAFVASCGNTRRAIASALRFGRTAVNSGPFAVLDVGERVDPHRMRRLEQIENKVKENRRQRRGESETPAHRAQAPALIANSASTQMKPSDQASERKAARSAR